MIRPMPTYSPPCICHHRYLEAEPPPSRNRFPVWVIDWFDPDCLQHGYITRINLAADLRFGD